MSNLDYKNKELIPGTLYQLTNYNFKWITICHNGHYTLKPISYCDIIFMVNETEIIRPKSIILTLYTKSFTVLWSNKYKNQITKIYVLHNNKKCEIASNFMIDFEKDWEILK